GNFKFIDTGHILGSRGLLIEHTILHTGDLSIRERAFISKPIIPKVETLIIESTFGKREYIFPPLNRVIHEVISLISSMYDRVVSLISKLSMPKAETLIIESTFGKREYIYPPVNRVIHEVNSRISSLYDRGVTVILMGYSLGKAQILPSLFGSWKPLIVHDEI